MQKMFKIIGRFVFVFFCQFFSYKKGVWGKGEIGKGEGEGKEVGGKMGEMVDGKMIYAFLFDSYKIVHFILDK